MSWLSGWLKEIIMVVLLATFVDLILPSRSMERYVKLVLSLLILLTLLSPLIKLLTEATDIKLAGAFNRINQQSGAAGPSLRQIMDQADQMKSRQQQQSLEWAAKEVAAQMKEQVQKESGKRAASVKVVLGMQEGREAGGSGGQPYIKAVTVVLQPDEKPAPKQDHQKGSEPSGDIDIEPVKPVQVEVDMNEDNHSDSGNAPAKTAGTAIDDDSGEQAKAIKRMLENNWGIEQESIVVQTGPSENRKL